LVRDRGYLPDTVGNFERVRILEDLRVAFKLDDKPVNVHLPLDVVNDPVVGPVVVGNASCSCVLAA
jgi:hypothetical protein